MNNTFYKGYYEDHYLAHHGILGMKWGKKNGPPYPLGASDHSASEKKAGWRKSLDGDEHKAISIKAAGHKALANIYGLNAKTYSKSNKTLSSMNEAARKDQLKKAEKAQKEANKRKAEKEKELQSYRDVDPDAAKNKETRRVALDYHNMSDLRFKVKYKTSKKTFAKRYVRAKGDTYTAGKRKAAIALAFIASGPPMYINIGNGKKLQVRGKAAAARALAYDMGSVVIGTNVGYKKAEEKYKKAKESEKR